MHDFWQTIALPERQEIYSDEQRKPISEEEGKKLSEIMELMAKYGDG